MELLVVDDEAPIRSLWERFIARWGFGCELATNGQEALDMVRSKHFPIIITDLAMPVLSGQELIQRVRQEQPQVQFIVTTGYGTIELAVEMMKAGVYDFLTKPINYSHAELIVKKCVDSIHAQQENVALRQKNRNLEELNELKEKFISITSHEMRTPVSIIDSVMEILAPQLTGQAMQSLGRLLSRASGQLTEIVDQMHELSHINSPNLKLRREPFILFPLCREIMEELDFVLEKRGHQITLDFPENLSMTADRLKFKKVVRELLQNAIKFTGDGGRITMAASLDENHQLKFTVADTGIGIPPENLDKIFHLFYEVGNSLNHHTSKDEFLGGGMGVGLSIVNDIVTAHAGKVEVESQVDQGTRFVVFLPQDPAFYSA
ncbi:MAG: hybrid sensor histidine kinase/response regulator [SAR324 cluster bacterium]|nr:hybrid sensor histidine kinase/response regulator [SAR324 cluster bacterium]